MVRAAVDRGRGGGKLNSPVLQRPKILSVVGSAEPHKNSIYLLIIVVEI